MINRYKLICCDVLFRMACRAAALSRNVIDMEFTKLQSHNEPDALRKEIQGLIDKADADGLYEAVLFGYGLCGNSTAGLKARGIPLVVPRAHDCCTLFLGSRERFSECFGERLSSQWSSHGYLERSKTHAGGADYGKSTGFGREYADLVGQYGEENAEYIWETLHPAHNIGKDERIYIDVAPFDGAESGDFHYLRYLSAVKEEEDAGIGPAAQANITANAPTAPASTSASSPPAMTESAAPTAAPVGRFPHDTPPAAEISAASAAAPVGV